MVVVSAFLVKVAGCRFAFDSAMLVAGLVVGFAVLVAGPAGIASLLLCLDQTFETLA